MNDVCVLIPHFNNPQGLLKCVNSIGIEEHVDVLIVDDGSLVLFDEVSIKNSFIAMGNVYFIYLEINKGIEYALNCGADWIWNHTYTYIARLDCDDICHPLRFKIQKDFMEKNPDYGLIGSWCDAIDKTGNKLFEMKFPTDYISIRNKMHLSCMFIHPSLFIRVEAFKSVGGYSTKYKAAEDYDLCFRIMNKYKVCNLPQKLICFEYTDNKGISSLQRNLQMKSKIKILINNFYFGIYPIVGIIRNCILYLIPRQFLTFVKIKVGRGI
jgi:glycosyltransferase involved in cell wall biosynthesis